MSAALPAQIDPWQAVAREAAFAGSLALSDLPRLRELLAGVPAQPPPRATFEIAFRRDAAGRAVVVGSVWAMIPLECQRCLGVLEHRVDAAIRLMLTDGAAAAKGPPVEPPEPYEALPVFDDRVRPAELIEDELLLALPQIARHPFGVCQMDLAGSGAPDPGRGEGLSPGPGAARGGAPAAERPKPFAVLAGWKADT